MDNIAIFGVPRSGTSWLSQIFNSHPDVALRFQPLFSYGHKGRLSESSSAEEIQSFFDEILCSHDAFTLMKDEFQKNYPEFQKTITPTHLVFKETRYLHIIENMLTQCSDIKIIGIVRNPLAVLASWVLAPKEFDSEWEINREWREASRKNQNKPEEFYGFNKWKETAEAFCRFEKLFPQQFMLVRYNELNSAPVEVTGNMFSFCGLTVCDQVEIFLAKSTSRHDSNPYSVFRSKANDNRWKDVLPPDVVLEIQSELNQSSLKDFL